jgi:predicted lactoylglutathione lyase
MKFACLGYMEEKKWESMSKSEQEAMIEECFAYDLLLREKGHWLDGGAALQSVSGAKTVRWNEGRVIVTDGPYAETKEQLGGVGVLEARDMDEAVEIMSKHPGIRHGGPFEIRPIAEAIVARWDAKVESTKRAMSSQIFVNLPVKDLNRSVEFFTQLGFTFNPQFTDESATCMIVSDNIFVMLLTEARFREFTPKTICDARQSTEVLVALSYNSRDAVIDLIRRAVAAGGSTYAEPKDYGFMYQHGFQDLDGHIWELVHMDMMDGAIRISN